MKNLAASTETAKVYRKAAKLLEDHAIHSGDQPPAVRFSCCAVAEAQGIFPQWNMGKKESRLVDHYRYIFDEDFGPSEEGRDHRVVALCMMAALVEAGDDKRL